MLRKRMIYVPVSVQFIRSLRKTETDTVTDTLLTRGRLGVLKILERVKGIEPSLSAWEVDNGRMTSDESGARFSIRNDWQRDWRTLELVRVE